MSRLSSFMENLHKKKRTGFDMTQAETVDVLGIIADNIMTGKSTLLDGDFLLKIRYALQSNSQRKNEYNKLRAAASGMGRSGGLATSQAKWDKKINNLKKKYSDYLINN